MLFSIGLILILGFSIGKIFNKLKLPSLIGMILVGILIGPSVLNLIDPGMYNPVLGGKTLSAELRQIALVVIITRAGLSLNISDLKKLGHSALLMCFVPATFEIIGVTIFGPMIFGISHFEAMLLGSVLGAVSPAIIVPRMIKLQEEGYKNVANLVLTGASCDDVFVIILFYSFLGLVENNVFELNMLYELPLSIVLGILLGVIFGLAVRYIFRIKKIQGTVKILITLSVSFIMIGIENLLKPYVAISSLLGVMAMGILLNKDIETQIELKKSYNGMWTFFEVILFVLVGSELNIEYALDSFGPGLLLLLGSLSFRSLGVLVCLIGTKFTWKERGFIIMAYLPKATVQASIGGVALSMGLPCGTLVLTIAVLSIVITAPLGALLIDSTYKHLLTTDEEKEKNLKLKEAEVK